MGPADGEARFTSRMNAGATARSAASKSRFEGAISRSSRSNGTAACRSATSARFTVKMASSAMGELHQLVEMGKRAAPGQGLARGAGPFGQGAGLPRDPEQGAGVERHRGGVGRLAIA